MSTLSTMVLLIGGIVIGGMLGLLLRNVDNSVLNSDWLLAVLIGATPVTWLLSFVLRRKRRHGRVSLDKTL